MSPLRVLLVQPNDDSREMYAEFLQHHKVQVLCAAEAQEALTLAEMADVIVTGIQLRGSMDGWELISRLRADDRTKAKSIIVLTSWAWQTERLRAQTAGCDAFLTKPCLPSVLLSRIREVRLGHTDAMKTKPAKREQRRSKHQAPKREH